ncbi:MAG TPA: hypothetical protein VKF80_01790 [Candidatus Eisenbacteria bacterium]|nr:hypothetical protein [Candidatus Eisenbacteria bacterium]
MNALFVPLILLALAPSPAVDQNVLRGVHTVEVLTESMDPTAMQVGFSPEEYRRDTVRRLRAAGLHVQTEAEAESNPTPVPCLYLRVGAFVQPEVRLALYSIDVELMDAVFLEREPSTFTLGSVWQSRGIMGKVATDHVDLVRGNVRDAVDQFIDAWAAANPR